MPKKEIEEWKCPACKEGLFCETSNNEDNEQVETELNLSLATEIGCSILQENENLKQELHETKNKKSLYENELEDKLQQKEEDIRAMIITHNERENEMTLVIKTLEGKLKAEQKLREELLIHDESVNQTKLCMVSKPKDIPVTNPNPAPKDFQTQIILQELNLKQQEIQNLNAAIIMLEQDKKTLEGEVLRLRAQNSNCLHCFPVLQNSQSNERIRVSKTSSSTQEGSKGFHRV